MSNEVKIRKHSLSTYFCIKNMVLHQFCKFNHNSKYFWIFVISSKLKKIWTIISYTEIFLSLIFYLIKYKIIWLSYFFKYTLFYLNMVTTYFNVTHIQRITQKQSLEEKKVKFSQDIYFYKYICELSLTPWEPASRIRFA